MVGAVKTTTTTTKMKARNLDEREKWVNKIDRTIRYHASSASGKDKSQLLSDDGMGGSSSNELFESSDGLSSFDMAKFDAELTESDAYLQLLIEQLKVGYYTFLYDINQLLLICY